MKKVKKVFDTVKNAWYKHGNKMTFTEGGAMIPDTNEMMAARSKNECVACGIAKTPGLLVCWGCFKYKKESVPFKDFPGQFMDWLKLTSKRSNP